jgi:hypothetical protein
LNLSDYEHQNLNYPLVHMPPLLSLPVDEPFRPIGAFMCCKLRITPGVRAFLSSEKVVKKMAKGK